MRIIELDDNGVPTQNGSIAIKESFHEYWDAHGEGAELTPTLKVLTEKYPLEYGEAYAERR